jgi:hypothetical protein
MYKLITPFGTSYHKGEGEKVKFPKSIYLHIILWKIFNVNIKIYRMLIDKRYPFSEWKLCYNQSARLLENKKGA